jgi:hypothetical protein
MISSIPDTASPMVWDVFLPCSLTFLHCIIKKEINQDSVDLRLRMFSEDLSTD